MSSKWRDCATRDGTYSFSTFTGHIDKPDLDDRDYRLVDLNNGLRAIVIHDDSADKAAACVTVQVGAMHDPDDVHGLAHFLEHMISKGSELFPEENDFLSYISSNGGARNASTGSSQMDYWFSIGAAHLPGGLARLAAFFHCPLFTESLTKREIYAVDSEYRKNIQNDVRRVLQINRTLSAPEHPYSKFSTGCVESITAAARKLQAETQGDGESTDESSVWTETRRRMVEWWKQEYCAGRMTLAVLGKESLEELTHMVVSLFSPISNRGLDPRPVSTQPVWGPNEMGSIIFIKTVKDYYSLTLTFMIPDQRPHLDTQPAFMISHFLGHEGPGSVYAYLKKKNWLISISAGAEWRNPSVQQLKVSVRLTKEGYGHYKDVLLTIYNYLSLLRLSPSPFPLYHFTEVHTVALLHFRFRERGQPHSYVQGLSAQLAEPHAPEHAVSGTSILRAWDEAAFKAILAVCTPEKGRVTLQAREQLEVIVGADAKWEKERWLGGEYCVQRLDAGVMDKANLPNENPGLHLPQANPFIPTNLSVDRVQVLEPTRAPSCIRRTPISTLWHKKDDQFWVPKAIVNVEIKSPLAYGTPRQALLTRILADLVDDALAEITYAAHLAGLSYGLSNTAKGICVHVSGYNDKLSVLLNMVLEKLKDIQVDSERLKVMMEQVKREYENFYLGQPSGLSKTLGGWALMEKVWTPAEKLAEFDFVEVGDVQRHKEELLSKTYIDMLVSGNVSQEEAIVLARHVEQCLSARPLSLSEHPCRRALALPDSTNVIVRRTHSNAQETNSSLAYFCQFGHVADVSLRPVMELIGHIMKEPAYSELRTKEQLGYVVLAATTTISTSICLYVMIQSTHAPWYLEDRVDTFFATLRGTLSTMSPEDFTYKKQGLIVKKLERVKNLREETGRFWARIDAGDCDFLRADKDAAAIQALSIDELLAVYDRLILPSAARKKLSIHLLSQQLREVPPQTERPGALVIAEGQDPELALFKRSMPFHSAAVPVDQTSSLSASTPQRAIRLEKASL